MANNPNFPTWTHAQRREAWLQAIAPLTHTGPRYKVVTIEAHYIGECFFDMQWYVVDSANEFRSVWSTPDLGGNCDAYAYAGRLNDADQQECNRLNAIRLNGLY